MSDAFIDPAVALAEARVAEARRNIGVTLTTLQARIDPRSVAREAVENIAETGEKALRTGVETAKAHPNVVVGALTLAFAVLTRRQIGAAFGRRAKPEPHRGATVATRARSIPGDANFK